MESDPGYHLELARQFRELAEKSATETERRSLILRADLYEDMAHLAEFIAKLAGRRP